MKVKKDKGTNITKTFYWDQNKGFTIYLRMECVVDTHYGTHTHTHAFFVHVSCKKKTYICTQPTTHIHKYQQRIRIGNE